MSSKKEPKNLNELRDMLSEGRKELLERFETKKWFKKTGFKLRKKLLSLPDTFDGFVLDLLERPEEIGGVDVLRLKKLVRGEHFIIPVFEVLSQNTNQIFTYEYASPREGKNPGFRGFLLLEVNGEIKYFVLKKTIKFAPATKVYDTIGGFVQFKKNQLLNISKKVEEEIKRELGIKEITIKRFIDLGQINSDVSMTNKHNSLFVAIIDASSSKIIRSLEGKRLETKKIDFDLIVEPIEKLREYVNKVDDSYFLSVVSRLISRDIVNF